PAERPSDYQDVQVLNTLDGFNVQPRLSIPFDGPIDVFSVSSSTVFLVSLGSTLEHGGDPRGTVVGINQVVWDSESNTLHVESDEQLAQHTRYALIVTNGLRDADGRPVQASEEFLRFVYGPLADPDLEAYREELREGLRVAGEVGISQRDVVSASVFTTLS